MENEVPKAETKAGEMKTSQAEVIGAKTASVKKSLVAKIAALKEHVAKMSRTTKTFAGVLVVFAILLGALYYFKGVFVAATVNGNPISRLSIVSELEKKAGKSILDTVITKKLIENEVKKQGIVVSSEDIDTEIKNVEAQIAAQGGTLEQALSQQGMTTEDLREQIMINKELEQVLGDKLAVSDEEVNQYLSANKVSPTKGASSDDLMSQTREQLKGQKFNTEAARLIDDLRAKAVINYYTQY
ncbi:MAG: SurA N-terminal domain-containing protein [Candidatus Moranbacteria bacterium]|nr:SurA N-terminal domain-containing protein [Candidatus Moranbacteria bacterium]